MDRSPQSEALPAETSRGVSPRLDSVSGTARARRSERWAWFACGAGLALIVGVALGPAFATAPSPAAGMAPAPALILPSAAQNQTGLRPIPMTATGMSADSNNRMIAVTGVDITGQSVLYLVDTIDKQLAVYQASGGAPGTNSIRLVGARRIDLDLQLAGFNDKTETGGKPLTYEELEKRFSKDVDGR